MLTMAAISSRETTPRREDMEAVIRLLPEGVHDECFPRQHEKASHRRHARHNT